MKIYFLIHRWKPENIAFACYTENQLRTLHRIFASLFVKALELPFHRADEHSFITKTVKSFKNN